MSEWLTCPQCGLKQAARPDSLCEKCLNALGPPPQPAAGNTAAELGRALQLPPGSRPTSILDHLEDIFSPGQMGSGLRAFWLAYLRIFFALAAAGLCLSVATQIASWFGSKGPLGDAAVLLHVGVFVVFIPMLPAIARLTRGVARKDTWNAALRGCPSWMRKAVYGFLFFAIPNFIYFVMHAPQKGGSGPMPPEVLRGFSGHWMAFYAASAGVFFSALTIARPGVSQSCKEGHQVPLGQNTCSTCGAPAIVAVLAATGGGE